MRPRLLIPLYRSRAVVVGKAKGGGGGRCRYQPFSTTPTSSSINNKDDQRRIVDLRSDTVTAPSRQMLQTALTAPTGDDVMGEDPTIHALEDYMADLFQKQAALFVPTGTMSNLVAIMGHCHTRAAEVIVGAASHISMWEGGGAAELASVHTRQLPEDAATGQLAEQDIRDAFRLDDDDHCAKTLLLCLENTHNMMGGVALPCEYMDRIGQLAHDELNVALHVDGARIFNAATALEVTVDRLCAAADSVSVCLSKGLGAPAGSVLVANDKEFIRLAKRARKRVGGGMRQAGVLAAMGLYAVQNNVTRLADDHARAQRLGEILTAHGFDMPFPVVHTNIIYFGLPPNSTVPSQTEFIQRLAKDWGVKIGGGYARNGGNFFRVVTHLDLTNQDIEYAGKAMVQVALGSK